MAKKPDKRQRQADQEEIERLRSKLAAASVDVSGSAEGRAAELSRLRSLDSKYESDKAKVRDEREKARERQGREAACRQREVRRGRSPGYSTSPASKATRVRVARVKRGPGFVVAYRSGLFVSGMVGINEPKVFTSYREAGELAARLGGNVYLADEPAVIGCAEPVAFARERSDEAVMEGKVDVLDTALHGGAFESKRRKH